ncbi:uncharacterized protein AMSG_00785 [Thecamonas trahens ATCC 50062]|uniref:Ras guanine nucleotide exchange factor A n=1 Tax=Thecamonas trahens ATCC 50062 TaxID=461836 RepID=A0A0L0DEB0_THETB|nr:hypothetical protein AMSG_00785 [Thecamonas trahens ATCC 50062]KNC50624.1 hypothetical protein AMSG_00785 [Thecamonas trahens ATCC 50062]|eukprot:XP_013762511.1 hypothetical protein AMSG_00785 [Thecamonas trahens ATCC 50062]
MSEKEALAAENAALQAQVAKLQQEQAALSAKVEKTLIKVIAERRALTKQADALAKQNEKLTLLAKHAEARKATEPPPSQADADADADADAEAQTDGDGQGGEQSDEPVSAAGAMLASRERTSASKRGTRSSAGSRARKARVAELEELRLEKAELVELVKAAQAAKQQSFEAARNVVSATIEEVKDTSVLERTLFRFARSPSEMQKLRRSLFALIAVTQDAKCELATLRNKAEATQHVLETHAILATVVDRMRDQMTSSSALLAALRTTAEERNADAAEAKMLLADMREVEHALKSQLAAECAAAARGAPFVAQRRELEFRRSVAAAEVAVLEARIKDASGPPAPTASQLAEAQALSAVLQERELALSDMRKRHAALTAETHAYAREEADLRRALETLIATKTTSLMSLRRLGELVGSAVVSKSQLKIRLIDEQKDYTETRLLLREDAVTLRGLQRINSLNADLAWSLQETEDENRKMLDRWSTLERIAAFSMPSVDAEVYLRLVAIFGEDGLSPPPDLSVSPVLPPLISRPDPVPADALRGSPGCSAADSKPESQPDSSSPQAGSPSGRASDPSLIHGNEPASGISAVNRASFERSFVQRARSSSEYGRNQPPQAHTAVDIDSILAADTSQPSQPVETMTALDRETLLKKVRARSAMPQSPGSRTSLVASSELLFMDAKSASPATRNDSASVAVASTAPADLDASEVDSDIRVRAGTLRKLVELLTYERSPMPSYVRAFLLTYRAFTSPLELLDLLVERYCITPPPELTGSALLDFTKSQQVPIRLRVFNILRKWIKDFYYDFEAEPELAKRLLEFVRNVMPATAMERPAKILERLLTRASGVPAAAGGSARDSVRASELIVEWATVDRASGVLPSVSLDLTLADVDIKSLALALSIYEQKLFIAIRPQEFLGLSWSKKGKETKAPNVLAMIRWFNSFSRFIVHEILRVEGRMADRVKILKRAIRFGHELVALNNLNGAMEVTAALQSSPIFRLKKHWAALDRKTRDQWDALNELLSRNASYKNMRSHLGLANPPCIPYLGMYLTDLTFIEDGNPDHVDHDGEQLINFSKCWLVAGTITQVRQYQQTKYVPEGDEAVDGFSFLRSVLAAGMSGFDDEEEAHKRSRIVEPRT